MEKRIIDYVYLLFRKYDMSRAYERQAKVVKTCMEDINNHPELIEILEDNERLRFYIMQTILYMVKN